MEPGPAEADRQYAMAGYPRILSAIILAAVLLRLALLTYGEQRPTRFDFPDSHRYLRVARNIADGRGPIDSETVRAGTDPVYPTLLAIGIKLGAESDEAVFRFGRIINAAFSIIAVLIIAALARRIGGDTAGLFAAALMAIDPISLFFNGLVLTETVYVTLLLAAVYSLSRLGGSRAPTFALVAGLLLGAGALTRSTSLFLIVVLIPAAVLIARPRKRWTCAALVLLGSAITIAPIVIRNYRLFGQFVPVRTGSGPSSSPVAMTVTPGSRAARVGGRRRTGHGSHRLSADSGERQRGRARPHLPRRRLGLGTIASARSHPARLCEARPHLVTLHARGGLRKRRVSGDRSHLDAAGLSSCIGRRVPPSPPPG